MFEVSPKDDEGCKIFKWYLKKISSDINLMMNAKNLVEFNACRLKLLGDKELWKGKKFPS